MYVFLSFVISLVCDVGLSVGTDVFL